jgi:Ca2+-binding EF-hand superfamily protein
MTASIPSTLSRYRPAILFLTGVSACYAAYILYDIVQTSGPGDGLHRSNAVRRRRPRDAPLIHALSLNDGDTPVPILGEYDLLGTRILLDPHNLVAAAELRDIIANAVPGANDETTEGAIERLYSEFLDRLLGVLSPGRALSLTEANAVRHFLRERYPDNPLVGRTAVASAAGRHAFVFPPDDSLALGGSESVAGTEVSISDDEQDGDAMDPEGQTLQRTLYHIAEDRARLEGVIHRGITCNGCDEKPIRGTRWHCANCFDFDLCSNCEATNSHYKSHIFYKIRVPAPYLGLQKQEPLYPGKPHMMSPSIDSKLKGRLVRETNMETEEIEALWDQFTCLAGTEWTDDTTGVGWAIDRREFNHAFIPRYNSFVAAPNLVYDRIFTYYDTDKNGLIGFDEWVKGLDGMHTTDVDVKARIVFNGYDIDGDGYISRKDILRIFRAYYAIEKEATRNHISELSDEVTVRNALETIRSSQPLGSAFPPRNMATSRADQNRLRQKQEDDPTTTSPVLAYSEDVAEREEILGTTDINRIGHVRAGGPSEEQRNDIVTSRWARRQFYIDEEEGLERPEGAETPNVENQEVADEMEQAADVAVSNEERTRNRGSRSSSRVRFEDEVEMETRSNASSSRPVGERWGGYEIPEPEQDLGKEVLYQITQQGFNELLNPLFLEKEDMAMDAHETRSERRKQAADIEATTMDLFTKDKTNIEAIVQVGVFRLAKCIVEKFCIALNNETEGHANLKKFFYQAGPRPEEVVRKVIGNVYRSIEEDVLRSIKISRTTHVDNMTMWNVLLCKLQLQEEAIDAVIECADFKGWVSHPELDPSPASSTYKDPTMPQFRPNSIAGAAAFGLRTSPDSPTEASETSDTDDSSVSVDGDAYVERQFFVAGAVALERQRQAQQELGQDPAVLPPTSPTMPALADEALVSNANPSSQPNPPNPVEDPYAVNWRLYTDNPTFHHLSITQVNGFDAIQHTSGAIVHSMDPYHPETNQVKPLQHQIRQMAMNPASPLHLIMLASLEALEQEISERKGSGLISFDEFVEHMRQGKLRFLESWMEWVSM